MRILTGADHRYFRCLLQFLRSARRTGIDPSELRIYDLGMTRDQLAVLAREAPGTTRIRFPFEAHPEHVRMERGTFAWKPILIAAEAERDPSPLLWLDSATLLLDRLDPIREAVDRTGLYTPFGGGGLARSDPETRSQLRRRGIDPVWETFRARAAGVVAFDPGRPVIADLIRTWRDLAMVPEVIAPGTVEPGLHNFDQTLLTALLYDGASRGRFTLTRDELGISSSRPVPFLIARAKVPEWLPLGLDPLATTWFRIRARLDAWHWRLRRFGTRPPPTPDHPIR